MAGNNRLQICTDKANRPNNHNKFNKPNLRSMSIFTLFANSCGNITVYPIEGLSPYQNKFYTPQMVSQLTYIDGPFEFVSLINPTSKNGIINVVKADFSRSTLSTRLVKFV